MRDLFQDTFVGQIVYHASQHRLLSYPEESPTYDLSLEKWSTPNDSSKEAILVSWSGPNDPAVSMAAETVRKEVADIVLLESPELVHSEKGGGYIAHLLPHFFDIHWVCNLYRRLYGHWPGLRCFRRGGNPWTELVRAWIRHW